ERSGSPVEVTPTGGGWSATNHFSRVGLLLTQGHVFAAFASHCDLAPYKGWVVAYDAATLALKGSYSTGNSGGIWQSGMGLSTDGNGSVFFVAGVSTAGQGGCSGTNLCQAVGRLTLGGSGLVLGDWYNRPLVGSDLDLATAFVLGGKFGFASGKDGVIHVLD